MTPFRQSFIRRGFAILLPLAIGVRAVPPALDWERGLRQRVAEHSASLSALKGDLASIQQLEDSAADVRKRLLGLASRVVPGDTHTEASAQLTTTMRAMLEGVGARVVRISPLPDSTGPGSLRRLAVRADFVTDGQGLVEALRVLRASQHSLSVSELHISANDPASSEAAPEELVVAMAVTAWRLAAIPDGDTR